MIDIVDARARSRMMSRIGGRDTKPELTLRRALHSRGFRYRLHVKGLPGKPDLVFPKYQAVIFVHGCFWHRHEGCNQTTTPATRTDFWLQKFRDNVERDRRNIKLLEDEGWRVKVVWECELQKRSNQDIIKGVEDWLKN